MTNTKGILVFLTLLLTNTCLGCIAYCLAKAEPTYLMLLLEQIRYCALSHTLIGLGLSLPLVITGSMLSWVQIALLLNGSITPHLGSEGFMKVLRTLFFKI